MGFTLKQLGMIAALACCAGGVLGVSAYAGPDAGKTASGDTVSGARHTHKESALSSLLSSSIYLDGLPAGWKYSLTPEVPASTDGLNSVPRFVRATAPMSISADNQHADNGARGFAMLPNVRLYPYLGTGYRYGQYHNCLGPDAVMTPDSSYAYGYNPNCGSVWYTGAQAGYSLSKRLALNVGADYTQIGNGEGAVQTIGSWLFQSQPTGQASWTTFRAGLEYHF